MQAINLNNPSERKKLIWAIGLGLVALLFLWWTIFGFGSSTPNSTRTAPVASTINAQGQPSSQKPDEIKSDLLNQLRPVAYQPAGTYISEGKRNIFAYYEPPPPVQASVVLPTPTPTPVPPVLLASLSPANVYARTSDFTLEVAGDKFTPDIRITIDGRELPTRYLNPQQLSATVPSALIVTPGSRQVSLRSSDGKLYSNTMFLSIAAPPTPNYNYIGILGTRRFIDTAILQDRNNRETLNVQRGDVLAGRFRVTSISEKELVLVDTNLKIKHTLPMTQDGEKGFNPSQRLTPKVDSEDDEP